MKEMVDIVPVTERNIWVMIVTFEINGKDHMNEMKYLKPKAAPAFKKEDRVFGKIKEETLSRNIKLTTKNN